MGHSEVLGEHVDRFLYLYLPSSHPTRRSITDKLQHAVCPFLTEGVASGLLLISVDKPVSYPRL